MESSSQCIAHDWDVWNRRCRKCGIDERTYHIMQGPNYNESIQMQIEMTTTQRLAGLVRMLQGQRDFEAGKAKRGWDQAFINKELEWLESLDSKITTPEIKPSISINIGEPPANPADRDISESNSSHITWWWLRRLGFRITSGHLDCSPHMVIELSRNQETALEVAAPLSPSDLNWFTWLRSDIAHSKCRFCFVRSVQRVGELVKLVSAMGGHVDAVEFDADQFRESLEAEHRDCIRRWEEYGKKQRYARVAGGM